jgi:hypothetical protein
MATFICVGVAVVASAEAHVLGTPLLALLTVLSIMLS